MRVSLLLVLPLLWSLTLSQHTVPYLSFMGQTLANHSYVDISQVGSGSNSVQCHTDLSTCCAAAYGLHRGDWYFPNGTRLPIPSADSGSIYEAREYQRVDFRNIDAHEPTGIYRCNIPTNAVHDNTDTSVRATVYVGLYNSSTGIERCVYTFHFYHHSLQESSQYLEVCH